MIVPKDVIPVIASFIPISEHQNFVRTSKLFLLEYKKCHPDYDKHVKNLKWNRLIKSKLRERKEREYILSFLAIILGIAYLLAFLPQSLII